MPNATDTTSIEHWALTPLLQEPLSVDTLFGKKSAAWVTKSPASPETTSKTHVLRWFRLTPAEFARNWDDKLSEELEALAQEQEFDLQRRTSARCEEEQDVWTLQVQHHPAASAIAAMCFAEAETVCTASRNPWLRNCWAMGVHHRRARPLPRKFGQFCCFHYTVKTEAEEEEKE